MQKKTQPTTLRASILASSEQYSFSAELHSRYEQLRPAIQARLREFAHVPPSQYFYELCFCLCTPQSKAEHAHAAVTQLQERDFERVGFDPTPLLAHKAHYIRFHNTKARRLLAARQQWQQIASVLASRASSQEQRDWLAEHINGFGLKEASHFLRNIGHKNLPILDRHTLKHLLRCGVFTELPNVGTRARYLEAAEGFMRFADHVGIPLDELDLLFWAMEAGLVLK
jgi:N-glycosylase/DNA lyase